MPEPTPIRRPSAKELANHPNKAVARQAQKVIAEEAKLSALFKEDAGKAELRAEIARREAELKRLKEHLRTGGTGAPKRDNTAIRMWASRNGYEVAAAGVIPQHVVDAYHAAVGAA